MLLTFLTTVAAFNAYIFLDDLVTPAIAMSRISVLSGFIIWLLSSIVIFAIGFHVIFYTTIVHLILLPLAVYPAFMQVVIFFGKRLTK